MSISKLSIPVSQRLKSSVVLVTPEAAVKELVDNAIDAGASIVEIRIAANTIDKIQVRDNGSGIDMVDFDCLGRTSHTSKLRTFEDLRFKAGDTLGFRGEALACARDVAKVSITTRTKHDTVARTFELESRNGGALPSKLIAAPHGTEVTLEALYSQLPVRMKEYCKKSQQTIGNIKRQLQAFAMARPLISISFKVLGGHLKQDWSYRPSRVPSARDAASQIFGVELVSQCISKTVSATQTSLSNSSTPAKFASRSPSVSPSITMDMLLPVPNAAAKVTSRKGAFISVDQRPITHTRGTMKKLVAILKRYLRPCMADGEHLSNPFLQLNISAAPGSYDVNITSAKDEVLFAAENDVLDLFEGVCRDTYSDQQPVETSTVFVTQQAPSESLLELREDNDTLPEQEGEIHEHSGLVPACEELEGSDINVDELFSELPPVLTTHTKVPHSHVSREAELARLQEALDKTLPQSHADTDGLREQLPEPLQNQKNDASAPPMPETISSRLRGWESDLARTRTISSEGAKSHELPLSSWPVHMDGPAQQSQDVSTPVRSNPWSIAKQTAHKSTPKHPSGITASPAPTSGLKSSTSAHETEKLTQQVEPAELEPDASERHFLLSPQYGRSHPTGHFELGDSPYCFQLEALQTPRSSYDGMHAVNADDHDDRHSLSTRPNTQHVSMQSPWTAASSSKTGPQHHSPTIQQAMQESVFVEDMAGMDFPLQATHMRRDRLGRPHEDADYRSPEREDGVRMGSKRIEFPLQDSVHGASPLQPEKQLSTLPTLSNQRPFTQLTLTEYLSGNFGSQGAVKPAFPRQGFSPYQAHEQVEPGTIASAADLAGTFPDMDDRDDMDYDCHRLDEHRTIELEPRRAKRPIRPRSSTSEAPHCPQRQQSTALARRKSSKRRRSSRLPLETILHPTTASELVIPNLNIKVLESIFRDAADRDYHIVQGPLPSKPPGVQQLLKGLEAKVQMILNHWVSNSATMTSDVDLKLFSSCPFAEAQRPAHEIRHLLLQPEYSSSKSARSQT